MSPSLGQIYRLQEDFFSYKKEYHLTNAEDPGSERPIQGNFLRECISSLHLHSSYLNRLEKPSRLEIFYKLTEVPPLDTVVETIPDYRNMLALLKDKKAILYVHSAEEKSLELVGMEIDIKASVPLEKQEAISIHDFDWFYLGLLGSSRNFFVYDSITHYTKTIMIYESSKLDFTSDFKINEHNLFGEKADPIKNAAIAHTAYEAFFKSKEGRFWHHYFNLSKISIDSEIASVFNIRK